MKAAKSWEERLVVLAALYISSPKRAVYQSMTSGFDLAQLEILRWSLQSNHKFVRLLSRMSRHRKTCTNLENQKTLWFGGQRTSVSWIRFGLWKLCGISSHWRPFPWPCRNFSVYHLDRQTRGKTHQCCHWSRLSSFMSQNPVVSKLPFFIPRFSNGWSPTLSEEWPPESSPRRALRHPNRGSHLPTPVRSNERPFCSCQGALPRAMEINGNQWDL